MEKVGVIGLGYVGLPLALRFTECNFDVLGFDVDEIKVHKIARSETYIKQFSSETIKRATEKGFSATTDFTKISDMEALIICVPTPLNKYREPDLSYIVDTINSLLPHLQKGQLLCLESTTYPGTTEEVLKPLIESKGFTIGKDFYLVYSPEREDPGNTKYTTQTIPKVVGGSTSACLKIGSELYEKIIDQVVPVSSTQTAEMTKLLENIHRAVNIGLVNEMKIIADKMGIDIHEVIKAAATKPFGFVPYFPGPGLGGHCIPIDPFYLTWKAKEYGLNTRFIELAGEINSDMPKWVISKVADALNTFGKSIMRSKILILGASYKKNVDDMRESPSVEILKMLMDKGADVDYSDPWTIKLPKMRKYDIDMDSVDISAEQIAKYDLVLLATDHDDFDYDLIQKNALVIVDTRGVYGFDVENVVKA